MTSPSSPVIILELDKRANVEARIPTYITIFRNFLRHLVNEIDKRHPFDTGVDIMTMELHEGQIWEIEHETSSVIITRVTPDLVSFVLFGGSDQRTVTREEFNAMFPKYKCESTIGMS